MTDAILMPRVANALACHGIQHEVMACLPDLADTAAFCDHYGFSLDQAANTIVVTSRKLDPPRYAVCVVLGTTRLDVNGSVRGLMEVKRASFADAETTTTLTGMLVGGVTAAGIDGLPIYVDSAVARASRIVMGAGETGPARLCSPHQSWLQLPGVQVIDGLARAPEATSEA